jgi:hypothetical protein
MITSIPSPIGAYLLAENSRNPRAVAACFKPDGVVRDEGKIRRGRTEIEAWKTETSAQYSAQIAPVEVSTVEGGYLLLASVSGNFPGSPLNMNFRFSVSDSLIDLLEIGV